MKKQNKKPVTDDSAAHYWDTHDATEVLSLNLNDKIDLLYEPPVQTISIRLPLPLINRIKQIASGMDIAYQALIKVWLAEKAKNERQGMGV